MSEAILTLSVANVRGNKFNSEYPNVMQITNEQELAKALAYDHAGGVFKDNKRGNANVIKVDCVIMDCDNDTEDSSLWLTPESIAERLRGVRFYSCNSKSNNKDKVHENGTVTSARPRFHIYFPLNKEIQTVAEIKNDP